MKKKRAGAITGIKAAGTFVVVAMLTPEESFGTVLTLSEKTKAPPQGYIIDIGPSLDSEKWGIKKGDRVLLQGTYVPVPGHQDNGRELGIVQPHDIKCILLEEE
jgi:co-chaperonin GroES (HSP10)